MNTQRSLMLMGLLLLVGIPGCGGRPESEKRDSRIGVLPAGEVHEGWYFAAGEEVRIDGTVNGDVYAAGGKILVNGTVNGDLIAAGGEIVVGGTVTDDVRAAGGALKINGAVGKNATLAGGSIDVGKEGNISGGLLATGGSVAVQGAIAKQAVVGSGEFRISGRIGGDVRFAGDHLSIEPGAGVGGNLTATVGSSQAASIAVGTVSGNTDIHVEEEKPEPRILGYSPFWFNVRIFWMLSLIVTAVLLAFTVPQQMHAAGGAIMQHPGTSLLRGILALVGIPLAILILFLTLVGIPLALLLKAAFLFALYLSQMSLGLLIAQKFLKAGEKSGWALAGAVAAGILAVQLLTFVPYLGLLLNLAALLLGLGAILIVIYRLVRPATSPA